MAITKKYGNKFIIPINFEMPYYQLGLGNRLYYEITFDDYDQIIKSSTPRPKNPDAKYEITDLFLEYKIITKPDLARHITREYQSMILPYDSIFRDRQIPVNKSDTKWSRSFNTLVSPLRVS